MAALLRVTMGVMPLLGPSGAVISTADYDDLDRKLRDGDGLGWPGDPRMWLQIGVVVEKKTGRQGRRLEVWRHNEDGSETMVGHWLPKNQSHVCYDLARMRVDSPGYVPTEERIDQENARKEKEQSDKFADVMGTAMDHWARLQHDLHNPRSTFYGIDGLSGRESAAEASRVGDTRTPVERSEAPKSAEHGDAG